MCLLAIMSAANMAYAANPVITQTTIPTPTQFTGYSTSLNATGSTGFYSWSLSAGALPAGLSLAACTNTASCSISGTPTVSGLYNFTVQAKDSGPPNKIGTQAFTGTITPTCQFSGTSTGTIAFGSAGSIDPSTSPGPITNTVTGPVNFQCGAGLAYTVAITNPTGQLQMTGLNTIPFTLGLAPSGTSASDATLIPLLNTASQIFNYQNFVAGSSSIGPITVKVSWGGAAPGLMNATVNVTTTTVIDACSTPVDGAITFSINPSSAGPLTPNTTSNGTPPTVKCTNQAVNGVSCISSHGNQLTIGNDGTTDPIAYTITGCPASIIGSGFLTATPINFGLSLTATGPGGYQNAQAGAHTDTITVQVSY